MKTPSIPAFVGKLIACFVLTVSSLAYSNEPGDQAKAKLEVHEWGTFTVLVGSDGRVIEWYQAPNKLVDLPPFVSRSLRIVGKAGYAQWGGPKDTIRMETPVLYFYPQEPMDISVSASFPMGRITEVFPPAAPTSSPEATIWHGSLLPPNSPERSKVPAATGPAGRHYAAAREVPDAWLFRNKPLPVDPKTNTTAINPLNTIPGGIELVRLALLEVQAPAPAAAPVLPTEPEADAIEPIDHFIFYRGAGNKGSFELSVVQGQGADTFTLTNNGGATVPKLFALRVKNGQTSWLALDDLATVDYKEGKVLNQQTFTFPAPVGPATEVAADVRKAMIASLDAEGLTADEADAMVATWDNLWFTDPGTRILAVLPKAFADAMVPLKINPTPKKIERVFVARVEIITREKEQLLTALLNPPGDAPQEDPATAADKLTALELGRYSAGGMERAMTIVKSQMFSRFSTLSYTADQQQQKLKAAQ